LVVMALLWMNVSPGIVDKHLSLMFI